MPQPPSKGAGGVRDLGLNEDPSHDLSLSDLSRRTGLTNQALREYEKLQLIEAKRNGSKRIYAGTTVRRVTLIKGLQRCGFLCGQIRNILPLISSDPPHGREHWKRCAEFIGQIDDRKVTLDSVRMLLVQYWGYEHIERHPTRIR